MFIFMSVFWKCPECGRIGIVQENQNQDELADMAQHLGAQVVGSNV